MANNNTELKGWAKYCKEQNIEFSTKRIFIDGLGGMAHGLFASLLIGCIINTIGMYVPLLKDIVVNPWMSDKLAGENLLIASKTAAYAVQGAAMAAAIAYSMKAPPFVMYSTLAVGFAANALGAQGGPLAVFFVVVIAVFFGKLVSKRTPIDIIVTPFVTIVFGVLFAFLIAPPIGKGAVLLGDLVITLVAVDYRLLELVRVHVEGVYYILLSFAEGDRSPALLDGHPRLRSYGHHPDPPHLLRRYLRRSWSGRSRRRRLRCWLLCSHGRLRCCVLP